MVFDSLLHEALRDDFLILNQADYTGQRILTIALIVVNDVSYSQGLRSL